ncbi:MAG TPA: histidine kinase [Ktedonobacteraceae bacterium]|nr:histidine kinase [Ktedonobacteraceae bacterium]
MLVLLDGLTPLRSRPWGVARQRRTTSFPHRRRRRHTNQRNGEYGCEAMHWLYEWMSVLAVSPAPLHSQQCLRRLSFTLMGVGQVQHLLEIRQQLASLEERQRVARDLHDSVKQQAFALTLPGQRERNSPS